MVDSNESLLAKKVLGDIPQLTGIMWDKIKTFEDKLKGLDGAMSHQSGEEQSEKMKQVFPLKQYLEGGFYTREVFMPKGSVVVNKIFTKIGTQRVIFVHEDTTWCGVYKTNAKTFEKAEADVYTNNYNDLPKKVIKKFKKLWQELQQVS
jgi:hypothetical protein